MLQFTAGYFAVMLAGGLLLTLGPGRAILALVPKPNATTRYILETVAGAAMLIGSAVLWRRRTRLANRQMAESSSHRRRSPVLLGATISAVELPTAFPYFAAIAAIVGSGLNVSQQILLVAIYNGCFVLPLLAIVATLAITGDRGVELLVGVRAYLRKRWPTIVAVIGALAGVFVTTLGVTGLELGNHGTTGSIARHVRNLITHGSTGPSKRAPSPPP